MPMPIHSHRMTSKPSIRSLFLRFLAVVDFETNTMPMLIHSHRMTSKPPFEKEFQTVLKSRKIEHPPIESKTTSERVGFPVYKHFFSWLNWLLLLKN
ncbi:hypothetical protein BgiMline_009498 [Biomphalaria glabrata]|nr:hypothetical protein BgiMline_023621 [Biomphalaria glabrata]